MSARLRDFVTLPFDESSPLNQAYLMERRAEDSANLANFTDSTKYYNLAIGMNIFLSTRLNFSVSCLFLLDLFTEHLKEAQKKALHPKSQELIAAQIDRDMCAISANQNMEQLRLREKELKERKRLSLNNNSDKMSNLYDTNKSKSDNVKLEIYRAMEQQGSLLEILVANNHSSHTSESAPVSPKTANSLHMSANKIPVCDKTTIEELKLTNQQLKLLVQQLLTQLDEENHKIQSLQTELQTLKQKEWKSERDTKSLPIYLDDSLEAPKLLY